MNLFELKKVIQNLEQIQHSPNKQARSIFNEYVKKINKIPMPKLTIVLQRKYYRTTVYQGVWIHFED